jgi:hypothetical protein
VTDNPLFALAAFVRQLLQEEREHWSCFLEWDPLLVAGEHQWHWGLWDDPGGAGSGRLSGQREGLRKRIDAAMSMSRPAWLLFDCLDSRVGSLWTACNSLFGWADSMTDEIDRWLSCECVEADPRALRCRLEYSRLLTEAEQACDNLRRLGLALGSTATGNDIPRPTEGARLMLVRGDGEGSQVDDPSPYLGAKEVLELHKDQLPTRRQLSSTLNKQKWIRQARPVSERTGKVRGDRLFIHHGDLKRFLDTIPATRADPLQASAGAVDQIIAGTKDAGQGGPAALREHEKIQTRIAEERRRKTGG